MDEERRTKIVTALHQYRETVLQQNLALLRILVDGFNYFGFGHFNFPESAKEPRDLLNDDVRAELIKLNSLDGVCDTPIDSTKREEWFSKIKTNIAEKSLDCGELPTDFPELKYLCSLVDGITGPGLPYYTEANQIEFITPSVESLEGQDYLIIPTWDDAGEREDYFLGLWEDWEIAVAFRTGTGSFALCGSCAIYCRHTEDDDNKEWKWRYGMFDGGWHSDMYNSVEEFLAFYAHHKEQTEETVRKDFPRLSYERMRPH